MGYFAVSLGGPDPRAFSWGFGQILAHGPPNSDSPVPPSFFFFFFVHVPVYPECNTFLPVKVAICCPVSFPAVLLVCSALALIPPTPGSFRCLFQLFSYSCSQLLQFFPSLSLHALSYINPPLLAIFPSFRIHTLLQFKITVSLTLGRPLCSVKSERALFHLLLYSLNSYNGYSSKARRLVSSGSPMRVKEPKDLGEHLLLS